MKDSNGGTLWGPFSATDTPCAIIDANGCSLAVFPGELPEAAKRRDAVIRVLNAVPDIHNVLLEMRTPVGLQITAFPGTRAADIAADILATGNQILLLTDEFAEWKS